MVPIFLGLLFLSFPGNPAKSASASARFNSMENHQRFCRCPNTESEEFPSSGMWDIPASGGKPRTHGQTDNRVPPSNGITEKMKRIVKRNDNECRAIYSCLDCYTARLCRPMGDGDFEEVATIPCPPSIPHCDSETGTCMYRADPMCINPDDFICPSDGNFPDDNCVFYHVCTNLTAEKRQCENEGEFYNAERGTCDRQTQQCGLFDCYQSPVGVKTPYTTAPNYFAYCGENNKPILIDKCPDGTWLNGTTQRCEPMCFHREGLIQDPSDHTKYYKCHKMWTNKYSWIMMKDRKSCPRGTEFNPEEFSCISRRPDTLTHPWNGGSETDVYNLSYDITS